MALTDRQTLFVEEYLACFNASQAARRAGYAPKTDRVIGWRNLQNPEIAEAIRQRLAESAMTADETLMRLAAHARGDIDDCLDDDGRFSLDKARKAKKTSLIKKLRIKETKRVIDDEEVITQDIEFELHDAQAALQLIGRHHKLFVDRTELTGKDGGPVEHSVKQDLSKLSVDELRALRALVEKTQDEGNTNA